MRSTSILDLGEAQGTGGEAYYGEFELFIADNLQRRDRQIFELTYIDGKKQREVAEKVGYSRSIDLRNQWIFEN